MVRERRRGGGQAHLSSEWRGRESLCYVMLCYVMLLAQGRLTYHLSGEGGGGRIATEAGWGVAEPDIDEKGDTPLLWEEGGRR